MNESPTRQAGMGGSAVLERLAASAEATGMPTQSRLLADADRTDRIDRALGIPKKSEALSIALMLDALLFLAIVRAALEGGQVNWSPVVVMALPLAALTIWASIRSTNRQTEIQEKRRSALAWQEQQGVPVTGYADWLACDRPLDVHMRTPVDRALFERAVTAIDAAIGVEHVGGRSIRLEIPPSVTKRGKTSVRHGNVALLHRVFAELVLPLHHDTGVERVEMDNLVVER